MDDVRRLVENVALFAPEDADLDGIGELVREAADRLESLPSLRANGGAASSPGPDGALFERSPIAGRSNPIAPPMHLEVDGDVARGHAVYTSAYEGPSGFLHGAFVAAAFDEVLGFAQMLSGSAGMTGTLTVRFRRPTPLLRRIDYEGGVDRVEGRKIFTWGRSTCDGELLSEAEGIFIARS